MNVASIDVGIDFPFDVVVITSPDELSSQAALDLFLVEPLCNHEEEEEKVCKIVSTCDPYGTKMGSGGGTIAALELGDSLSNEPSQNVSILIVHAGGDSSRCPTQMSLGKAWTSLPVVSSETNSEIISNPTYLLVKTLSNNFCSSESINNNNHNKTILYPGSVVVAASDVLIYLPKVHGILDNNYKSHKDEMVVYGLAVPAKFQTAKNHGVFVLETNSDDDNDDDTVAMKAQPVERFLQKPSIATLKSAFSSSKEELAWIDTGVVIFTPRAAQILRNGILDSQSPLYRCSRTGLQTLYKKSSGFNKGTIEEFAKEHTLQIELYSHMLMALHTTTPLTKQTYLQAVGSNNDKMTTEDLEYLYHSFSKINLFSYNIPKGKFCHLGTTRELMDLLLYGSNTGDEQQKEEYKLFGDAWMLTNRAVCHIVDSSSCHIDASCVLLNTIIESSSSHQIQVHKECIIEHCDIFIPRSCSKFVIGDNCLLSGLRKQFFCSLCTDKSEIIRIPKGLCIQQLAMEKSMERDDKDLDRFVLIMLHVDDEIKKCNTIMGISIEEFLQLTNLTHEDLWDDKEDKRMIWNGNFHPRFTSYDDIGSSLYWIFEYLTKNNNSALSSDLGRKSLEHWKSLPRVSLKEIRKQNNAFLEFQHRKQLSVCQKKHTNRWHVATAPARIDIHGGWTDTPPICYEHGGCVTNIAVKVDGLKPLGARSRLLLSILFSEDETKVDAPCVRLISESRQLDDNGRVEKEEVWLTYVEDLCDFNDPINCKCAILKAALICIGLVSEKDLMKKKKQKGEKTLLSPILKSFISNKRKENLESLSNDSIARLEIISTSLLPRGSGMGGSSILGGCILASLYECFRGSSDNLPLLDLNEVIYDVLYLEQLLTTGGGFQDQVGGLLGGAKVSESDEVIQSSDDEKGEEEKNYAKMARKYLHIQPIPLNSKLQNELDKRLLLVYTGIPRLAKNLLRNVLNKWESYKKSPEEKDIIIQTLGLLVEGGHDAAECLKWNDNDIAESEDEIEIDQVIEQLGQCMKKYWECKKIMATPPQQEDDDIIDNTNPEPKCVKDLLMYLYDNKSIFGGTLAGAGGGGFLALISTSDHMSLRDSIQKFSNQYFGCEKEQNVFSIHSCTICDEGLTVREYADIEECGADYFKLDWHS